MSATPLTPDFDALLVKAAFNCQIATTGVVRNRWVPTAERTNCNKLYTVWGGTGVARLNRSDYKLRAGDVYLIPAGTIQQGDTDAVNPIDKAWVHFESFTYSKLELLRLFPPPMCLQGKTAQRIAVLTRELLAEWQSGAPARLLAVNSLLMRVLLEAYRAPAEDIRPPDTLRKKTMFPEKDPSRLPVDRIRKTLALVNQQLATPLQLGDLAKCACLHPAYFTQVFKRLVGMPPMKYLERQRVQRAQELLSSTEKSVSDIAQQVGFPDPYHFSRVFRKNTGQAPSAFRAYAREQDAGV